MNISVFGMGYVGCVTAGCLAELGHSVMGVDISEKKVSLLNQGDTPIVEDELSELIRVNVERGRLRATMDAFTAVMESDISIVCVGTPSRSNGSLETTYLERVCLDIGRAIAHKEEKHIVVLRSTTLPGIASGLLVRLLEECSGKKCSEGFGFCVHPEFLREGTAVHDFNNPPKIVIGAMDEKTACSVSSLYENFDAPIVFCGPEEASLVKYADNCFHAVKIVFANEIGRLCNAYGIDGRIVMDIFCRDKILNISKAYLRPGFAYGGSCLPKDIRAICYNAREKDVKIPMLESLESSNGGHIDRLLEEVFSLKVRRIGILGLSFKKGTDDVRESPMVRVVETLIGKGYHITIRDPYVSLARLIGANKEYLEKAISHITDLLRVSTAEVITESEALIMSYRHKEFDQALQNSPPGLTLLDVTCVSSEAPLPLGCRRIV